MTRENELSVTPEEFSVIYKAETTKYLPTVDLMPGTYLTFDLIFVKHVKNVHFVGALKIVKHLYDNHIPIAIATSSSNEALHLKFTKHQELLKYFNHYVCGGSDPEVKNSKPAPDIFLICASRFTEKPKPKNILVIEDAPNGLAAGLAANMNTIIVPDPALNPLTYKQAQHVYKSLEDIQLELFGLPPFK